MGPHNLFHIAVRIGVDVGYRGGIPLQQHFKLQIVLFAVLLQYFQALFAILMDAGAQIGDEIGLLGDHVGRVTALHLGEAAGGGQDGLAKGRYQGHRRYQHRFKQPDVTQQHPHAKGKCRCHGLKHSLRLGNQLLLEGALALDLVREGIEPGSRGAARGCGAVSTLAPGRDLHIHVPLFRNAQHCVRTIHTGYRFLNDRTAFIHYQSEPQSLVP